MQTLKNLLDQAISELGDSRTARLDAEVLICCLLKKERSFVYSHPEFLLSAELVDKYFELINRRKSHEPVAYITGVKEFYGMEFCVTPDVLIPRPETELMIEEALKFLNNQDEINILDLCTGSGCIAITLAAELKKIGKRFKITASDISKKALNVARQNAQKFSLSDEINFVESDLFKNLDSGKYNLILSNPPYVNPRLPDLGVELKYEPALALFAENNGLKVIEEIISKAPDFLTENSMLIIEIGAEQGADVLAMPFCADFSKTIIKDLSGLDRFICFSKI